MMQEQSKTFHRVVSVAQTFLADAIEKGALTPALVAEKVDFVANAMLSPGEIIDRKKAVAEIIRRFRLSMDGTST